MFYVLIALLVFILSSVIIYSTTHKKYIGPAAEKGIIKAQYLRAMFGVSLFFTAIVMLLIKAFKS
jgi:hypothetical protein